MKKAIGIRVDFSTYENIKKAADKQKRKVSALIKILLEETFDKK